MPRRRDLTRRRSLTVAIGAFVTSDIVFIKLLGIGIAAGVMIDATVVRAFLVPSLMALLGEWNWWAPAPLRRIYGQVGVHEAEGPKVPPVPPVPPVPVGSR